MENKITFNVNNDDGKLVEIHVLSLIDSKEGDIYVIYTDYTTDENNFYNVYISKLESINNEIILTKIESEVYQSLLSNLEKAFNELNNIIE